MHCLHDVSEQIKLNKISLNLLFRSIVYTISVALYKAKQSKAKKFFTKAQAVASMPTECYVYNSGGQKIDKQVFSENETKIVKSKVSLPVCL